MDVTLYTTHCPKCSILEKKLTSKNIEYEEVTNTQAMLDKGFVNVPILEVDGIIMDFTKANTWINEQ